MAHYTLDCIACGVETASARKDARHCRQCRIRLDLAFARSKTSQVRRCRLCGDQYRPYRDKDLAHCAACTLRYSKRSFPEGSCAFCVTEAQPLVNAEVPICLYCMKHPTRQADILRALTTAFEDRRAKYAHRVTAPRKPTPVSPTFTDDPCAPAI